MNLHFMLMMWNFSVILLNNFPGYEPFWFQETSCAICGQIGLTFDAFPLLKSTNIQQAYTWLLILLNWFRHNHERLDSDSTNQQTNQSHDLNAMYNVTISQFDALEAINVTAIHQTDDCWFSKIQSLLEDKVTPMLQTHHIAIANLLNTIASSPTLSSLLSGGVVFPPSGGVHSTDLPQDTHSLDTRLTGSALLASLKE